MKDWPVTIPKDLREALDTFSSNEWLTPLRTWAEAHGLQLAGARLSELERKCAELERWRWPASHQDRWILIREWLICEGFHPPADLPLESEIPSCRSGH
ncbi:hypothetical protein [Leisingera caerulea]|uniref:hypothetical protein n=1 Tax=Leisingera caerulea TaxID=506591 RepID=UPI00041BBD94|nr:hypothetical protein [Leisingera caerulea]